jgi:hypothetical protein
LTERHTSSVECRKHTKTKTKRKKEIIQQAAPNVKFLVGQDKITITSSFKYLGRIITNNDDDLPAVEVQIKKSRKVWARINKILNKKQIPTSK